MPPLAPRKLTAAMRIVFMGSPDFAVPSLNALVEAGHEIIAAYSQPPRPAGRGKAERKTAVHERAEALGIEVRTPRTLRDAEEQARFRRARRRYRGGRSLWPDPAQADPRGAARRGCINVHASLLPRWRGAAPIQRAILAGDEVSGVTIMRMDEGLDTGPMLLDARARHSRQECRASHGRAGETWCAARSSTGSTIRLRPSRSPIDGVTYASKIDKAEARIDWTQAGRARSSGRCARSIPCPARGSKRMASGSSCSRPQLVRAMAAAQPGEVAGRRAERLRCGEGAHPTAQVQRAGRGSDDAGELLRGFPIPRGTILP